MDNSGLNIARKDKKDEFYTRYSDIEKELAHYADLFRGKVVYCNCDDYRVSNFFAYFKERFAELGLKKLVATCYVEKNLLNMDSEERAVCAEYDGNYIKVIYLDGDGDFRSSECVGILKASDVVVTNPPFSLFRDFVSLVMKHGKEFVVLGNINAVTTKELFQYFKRGEMSLGVSIRCGGCVFDVPTVYETYDGACGGETENGKTIRVRGIRWFTNMGVGYEPDFLETGKKFDPYIYSVYDNYNAINVDKVEDIPMDYEGTMGVPVTFMDKYNSRQFELVGHEHDVNGNGGIGVEGGQFTVDGKGVYKRILIRKLNK